MEVRAVPTTPTVTERRTGCPPVSTRTVPLVLLIRVTAEVGTVSASRERPTTTATAAVEPTGIADPDLTTTETG